ncbi:MAG: hypothetical protein LBH44_05630 [Treponema sp.]|jgi:hypothetical protein|nr:hypothetical protein [Treponema sp.]
MGTNNRLLPLLAVMFLLTLPLAAQNESAPGYYEEEGRFIQRLAWTGDGYALRYEVIIEKENKTQYSRVLQDFTDKYFIEVSLPPGKYRYRIIPYDFLNVPHPGSAWVHFEILAVQKPKLDYLLRESISDDGETAYTLFISKENTDSGAEIYLRSPESVIITPVVISIMEEGIRLVFVSDELVPEINYELVIRNPGGQETIRGGIRIAGPEPDTFFKSLTIYAGAAWMPVVPVYGGMEQQFGQAPYPSGAALYVGMNFNKPELFHPGAEFAVSWYAFDKDIIEYNIATDTVTFDFNLTARKWFWDEKAAVTLRAGVGLSQITITCLISSQEQPFQLDRNIPHANLGASFLWSAQGHLYLEAGFCYNFFLTNDASVSLRPWLGICWQF